jgi:hypothetical protein
MARREPSLQLLHLPDALLASIFAFLGVRDHLVGIERTCISFRLISNAPDAWPTSLSLIPDFALPFIIISSVWPGGFEWIGTLDLQRHAEIVTDDHLHQLLLKANVKRCTLVGGVYFTSASLGHLISASSNLAELWLPELDDFGSLELLSSLPSLRTLFFSSDWCDAYPPPFAKMLQLEVLKCTSAENSLEEEALAQLKHLPHLLELEGYLSTRMPMRGLLTLQLTDPRSAFASLRHLKLVMRPCFIDSDSDDDVDDVDDEDVGGSDLSRKDLFFRELSQLNTLTTLNLSVDCGDEPWQWQHIEYPPQAFSDLPCSITELDLNFFDCTPEVITNIGDTLPHLTILTLYYVSTGAWPALGRITSLEELRVTFAFDSEADFDAVESAKEARGFEEAMLSMPLLKVVDVSNLPFPVKTGLLALHNLQQLTWSCLHGRPYLGFCRTEAGALRLTSLRDSVHRAAKKLWRSLPLLQSLEVEEMELRLSTSIQRKGRGAGVWKEGKIYTPEDVYGEGEEGEEDDDEDDSDGEEGDDDAPIAKRLRSGGMAPIYYALA